MERIPNLQVIGQADPKDKEQTKDFLVPGFLSIMPHYRIKI
ncbi:MAG TPA: hypothetical protein PLP46_01985 [bacterium]|nr:hypothetical protein [bacterium]HOQ91373.1 hypothetical protein [bacterium]HPL22210.1 hypothetical protein [bacterium]